MKITVVVGNPKPGSRTLGLAHMLASSIAGTDDEITSIDLAEHLAEILVWPSTCMSGLNDAVAASDLVIVGSPTYKATYTGVLKCFLDRYPSLGLRNVCAIPLMTGADRGHSMAPEVCLRPLLVELGALVPSAGCYVEMSRIDDAQHIINAWVESNTVALQLIRANAALNGRSR